MHKKAQSLVEVALIAMFVGIVVFAGWGVLGKIAPKTSTLSAVKINGATDEDASGILDKINGLNKNAPDYIEKRIETCGALGELIAAYQKGNTSYEAIITDALKALNPDVNAEACISSPSSCTALSTVTDFKWTLGSSSYSIPLSNTYNGKKIPVCLTYTYSYVDDSGKLVSDGTIVQDAFVQKEQNAAYKNKTFSSFITNYMDNKFSDTKFTGATDDVQTNIEAYLTGTNCVLSKSDSEDVNFSEPE